MLLDPYIDMLILEIRDDGCPKGYSGQVSACVYRGHYGTFVCPKKAEPGSIKNMFIKGREVAICGDFGRKAIGIYTKF